MKRRDETQMCLRFAFVIMLVEHLKAGVVVVSTDDDGAVEVTAVAKTSDAV